MLKTFDIKSNPEIVVLSHCTGLKSLPSGLSVGKVLHINGCTGITSLPNNLFVGGVLDVSGCPAISKLPDSLPRELCLLIDSSQVSLKKESERLGINYVERDKLSEEEIEDNHAEYDPED